MHLPNEIIECILSYLPHGELLVASRTCKLWYTIARRLIGKKDLILTITPLYMNSAKFKSQVLNSDEPIRVSTIILQQISLKGIRRNFWLINGKHVKELIILESNPIDRIKHILEMCPNLERLTIEHSENAILMRNVDFKLEKLTCLKISSYKQVNVNPEEILKNNPNLAELSLSACDNSFDANSRHIKEASLKFPKLKRLILNDMSISNQTLVTLSDELGIKLDHLGILSCSYLDFGIMSMLRIKQNTLTSLSISDCRHFSDSCLIAVCMKMNGLKKLNISKNRMLTDSGLRMLNLLKQLRHLDISQCRGITSFGLETFFRKPSCSLLSLNLAEMRVSQLTITMMVDAFPSLKILCVDNCFGGLTDRSMQYILRGLTNLVSLSMVSCLQVSDHGFTGTNYVVDTRGFYARDCTSIHDYFTCKNVYRKNEVTHSLSDLERMAVLDLSGCALTDMTVIKAFKFTNLIFLNLNYCTFITSDGVMILTVKCPSIAVLKLKYCSHVDDNAAKAIARNLRNLRELNLTGCKKITSNGAFEIVRNCKMLKIFDISNCPYVHRNNLNLGKSSIHTATIDPSYSSWFNSYLKSQ